MKDNAPNAEQNRSAGAGSRPRQGWFRSSGTALDVAQARASLRAAWLVADSYSPAELAQRLPAPLRAEFVEYTPQLVWFLQTVAALVEEGAEL